jgi:hypothetical protein
MTKIIITAVVLLVNTTLLFAQTDPNAGKWKPWLISTVKDYGLPAPSPSISEINLVISIQKQMHENTFQQILYWNAVSPGYRWQKMMDNLWTVDTNRYAILANVLLGTSIYDATLAAWDTKYIYKSVRPFEADKRIKIFLPKPESPSYPCEYSVAAGVAVAVFSKFYPMLADSVKKMAEQQMASRIAAGFAYPSDTKAGFELGKKIAEAEIEYTKDFISKENWDGKVPQGPQYWKGTFAMYPTAGKNKTFVLNNSSQFRPAPPPDYAKEMAELKNYKKSYRSIANAFFHAEHSWFMESLPGTMFERNLQYNAPVAARIQAAINIAAYDCFVACWDAKYSYWGIRPNQYDTTFKPTVIFTPPFPGYPSGHAAISSVMAEVYAYFFPENTNLYRKKALEVAESRFQAGIHFRSDNEVATELGKKVASLVIERLKKDGSGNTGLYFK